MLSIVVQIMLYLELLTLLWEDRILTFNHDHVDVDGADVRLGQTFTLLQEIGHLPCSHILVRPTTVGEQLPYCHTWKK